jgi:hypothetical protein
VLLLQDPSDLGDNNGRLGFGDSNGLGLAIDEKAEDVFFMVPPAIATLELFERDRIFATNVARSFGLGENGVDAVKGRSGDASQ